MKNLTLNPTVLLRVSAAVFGLFMTAMLQAQEVDQTNPLPESRNKAFLKKVLAVASGGKLIDIGFVERTMGIKLKLFSEENADTKKLPGAVWSKRYMYLVEEASFPMDRSATENAVNGRGFSYLHYIIPAVAGNLSSADLRLQLSNMMPDGCVTESQMIEVFGAKPRPQFASTHDSNPVFLYAIPGDHSAEVRFSFPASSACASDIAVSQKIEGFK